MPSCYTETDGAVKHRPFSLSAAPCDMNRCKSECPNGSTVHVGQGRQRTRSQGWHLCKSSRRFCALLVLHMMACLLPCKATSSDYVHHREEIIAQAFHGRRYGGENSTESTRALGIGRNGEVYITGNTEPRVGFEIGWGNKEPGDDCKGVDIFVAKISRLGQLAWVRRAGSPGTDRVSAMHVGEEGLYICGRTDGKMGSNTYGGADVFVSRYDFDGSHIWTYQLGSSGIDECTSVVSAKTKNPLSGHRNVYIAGSTNGTLFSNGADSGTVGTKTFRFIAKLRETNERVVMLVDGSQKGVNGMSTVDGLGISGRYLYVLSNSYNDSKVYDDQSRATLELLHLDSLRSSTHHATTVDMGENRGFFAQNMRVDRRTREVYIAGVSYSPRAEKSKYGVLKYSVNESRKGQRMQLAWLKTVGRAQHDLMEMHERQKLSLAIDPELKQIHVAGVVDDYFPNEYDATRGLLITPIFTFSTNGTLVRSIHRSTAYPEMEELVDIAVDRQSHAVIYAGSVSLPRDSRKADVSGRQGMSIPMARPDDEKVLLGSFGHSEYASPRVGEGFTTTAAETALLTSAQLSEAPERMSLSDYSRGLDTDGEEQSPRMGPLEASLIAICAVGGVLILAMVIAVVGGTSGRRIDLELGYGRRLSARTESEHSKSLGMMPRHESKRQRRFSTSAPEADAERTCAGGSAGPQ